MNHFPDDFFDAPREDKPIDPEVIRGFLLGRTEDKDLSKPGKKCAEVDLHLDEATKSASMISVEEKLNHQLRHLEKQLDKALANGCGSMKVIHGKGEGKLKEAVHALLKKNKMVKNIRMVNDPKHQGGATEVFFR